MVAILYLFRVYFEQVHPLHYIPITLSSSLFIDCLLGSIMLSLSICMQCISVLFFLQCAFLYLLLPLTLSTFTFVLIIVINVINIVLDLGSTSEREMCYLAF
jgi:hypothetical protein